MRHIVCLTCGFCLRVSAGADGEIDALIGPHDVWYPDRYPCARCSSDSSIVPSIEPSTYDRLDVADVSPSEALSALHGLGLPKERECSPAAVQQLLTGVTIKRVVTRTIRNSHRSILEYIEIEDGTRVYLAASTHGATVYRISPRGSYLEEALRER